MDGISRAINCWTNLSINRCLAIPELRREHAFRFQHHFNRGPHVELVQQLFSKTFYGMKTDTHLRGNLSRRISVGEQKHNFFLTGRDEDMTGVGFGCGGHSHMCLDRPLSHEQ